MEGVHQLSFDRQQQTAIVWGLSVIVVIWLVNGVYLAALASVSVSLFWLADLCQWVLLPSVFLAFLARKVSLPPKHYGLDTAALCWQSLIFRTLIVFVTDAIIFFGVRKVSWELLGHPVSFFSFPGVFPSGPMGNVVWLYAAATAGIVESIFFIGLPWLMYQHFRVEPSRILFSILTSIVFALSHWEQGAHVVIGAFFSNLIACFWFFRFGNLWPVAVGHILVDLIAFA